MNPLDVRTPIVSVFAGVALLLGGDSLLHLARLVRDVALPPFAHRALRHLNNFCCSASVPLAIWLGRGQAAGSWRPVLLGLGPGRASMFLLLMLLRATDIGRLVWLGSRSRIAG
jgi:hypothetical protein